MGKLLPLFLLIVTILPSRAQSWEQEIPLTKTQLHQTRLWGTEEWGDYRKTDHTYDHYNRETGQKRWRKGKERWILSSEIERTFDENGAQDSVNRKYYTLTNGTLRFEIINNTDYEKGNLVLDYTTLEDFEDGSIQKSLTEITYDPEGNMTERVELETDKSGYQSGTRMRQTFDEQGCRVSMANAWLINRQWLTIDSSHFVVDASCELLQWEYYFSNSFQFRRRYETRVDDAGRVKTKFIFSQAAGDTVWNYYSEEQYEYDEAGNNTYYNIRNYQDSTERRTLRNYDTENRLTSQTRQYKGFNDEFWINDYEFILEYNVSGNRNKEIFRNRWDESSMTYSVEYKLEIKYDVEGRIENTTSTTSLDNNVYSRIVIHNNYRCDDALTEERREIIVSPNSWDQYEHRYAFEYYHKAPCQDLTATEADIKLFPNPATDYIHVISPKPYGRSMVSLITTAGHVKMRREVDLSNYFSLDISGLDMGIYILKIQSPEGEFEKRLMVY